MRAKLVAKTRSSSGLSPPQGILGPRTLLLLRPFLNSFSTTALMKRMSGDKKKHGGGKDNNNNDDDDKLKMLMTKAGSGIKMLVMTCKKSRTRGLD